MKYLLLLLALALQKFSTTAQIPFQPKPVWQTATGTGYSNEVYTAISTQGGGYLIGGNTGKVMVNGNFSYSGFWIAKLDSYGNIQWQKSYKDDKEDVLISAMQLADGSYMLAGSSESGQGGDKSDSSRGMKDFWLIKTDASGKKIWDKTYGGPRDDQMAAFTTAADGGFILVGNSRSGQGGDKTEDALGAEDIWIVKTDAEGNKQWDKTIGGIYNDIPGSIIQTKDGGYAVCASSASPAGGWKTEDACLSDFWLVKMDSQGNRQWDKSYGTRLAETGGYVQQTDDEGFVIAGYTASAAEAGLPGYAHLLKKAREKGFWLIKTDKDGKMLWDKAYGTENGGEPKIALGGFSNAGDGYIFAGGSEEDSAFSKTEHPRGGYDYWLVRVDGDGKKLWDKTVGGRQSDVCKAVVATQDGYLAVGNSLSKKEGDRTENSYGSSGNADCWIVMLEKFPTGVNEQKSIAPKLAACIGQQGSIQLQLLQASAATYNVVDMVGRIVATGTIADNTALHIAAQPGLYQVVIISEASRQTTGVLVN